MLPFAEQGPNAPQGVHLCEQVLLSRAARQGERRLAISAFQELLGLGEIGPECLQLVSKLVREEARKLPALAPPGGSQPADLEDLVGDFLVEKGLAVTTNLLALASDDASVGRLLRTSIRHWLIDKSRKSGIVALGRSLSKVLESEAAFEQVPDQQPGGGRWRLAGSGASPWSGATSRLVEAARAVPNVRVPRWSSDTRRAPVADRASIVALLRAVLTAADGSLEVSQLCEIFAERFPAVLDPVVVPLEAGAAHEPAALAPSPEEAVLAEDAEFDAAVTAAEVVGMLSPQEQRMVPLLAEPQRIQELLACGRSQAYHQAKRLREKLAQFTGGLDDAHVAAREVIRLCGAPSET
ncbi:hypothetical protein OG883_45285 [Streptomyces sp. NBC_01142]|uniref:hypothetical protein n=1 Tax=Streptomyces sp. NBC_01142 TaxID=2975865 RepID=UPI0022521A02|nr:hypothetical protein [Streptomyces sp. NBC_01142]MCX4826854.1 hypothetical protein [Streptomyces sp. NBC_01142]